MTTDDQRENNQFGKESKGAEPKSTEYFRFVYRMSVRFHWYVGLGPTFSLTKIWCVAEHGHV